MAQDAKNTFLENISVSLPSLGVILMMFIGAAFTLVSFIYTSGQSEINAKLEKAIGSIEKYNNDNEEMQKAMITQSSRLDRYGEQISENKRNIESLQKSQQELEKAAILSNATRR